MGKITLEQAQGVFNNADRSERGKNIDKLYAKQGKYLLGVDDERGSLYLTVNGTRRYDFKGVDDATRKTLKRQKEILSVVRDLINKGKKKKSTNINEKGKEDFNSEVMKLWKRFNKLDVEGKTDISYWKKKLRKSKNYNELEKVYKDYLEIDIPSFNLDFSPYRGKIKVENVKESFQKLEYMKKEIKTLDESFNKSYKYYKKLLKDS